MLEIVLLSASMASLLVLLALLIRKCVFRVLPAFFAWMVWNLLSSLLFLLILRDSAPHYAELWIVNAIVDTSFYFLVLMEAARNMAHFNGPSARWSVAALIFPQTLLVVYLLSPWTLPSGFPLLFRLAMRILQITIVTELAAILTIAVWSNLLHLRWPEWEFQVTTGMGIYTIITFATTVARTHSLPEWLYTWLDQVGPYSYLGVLIFWVVMFARHTNSYEPTRDAKGSLEEPDPVSSPAQYTAPMLKALGRNQSITFGHCTFETIGTYQK